MIWKEPWKVDHIRVVCYEILKEISAIGMRGPIYGVIQNVCCFLMSRWLPCPYAVVVGCSDDLRS